MKHLLSILAFVGVSFGVQAMSHFVLNTEHYATITFMRPSAIMSLGIAVMIGQAVIMTFAMTRYRPAFTGVSKGLEVSVLFGGFLAGYIIFVEPAKYVVPDISEWIAVEATASAVQFLLFGILLGSIHKRFA